MLHQYVVNLCMIVWYMHYANKQICFPYTSYSNMDGGAGILILRFLSMGSVDSTASSRARVAQRLLQVSSYQPFGYPSIQRKAEPGSAYLMALITLQCHSFVIGYIWFLPCLIIAAHPDEGITLDRNCSFGLPRIYNQSVFFGLTQNTHIS